MVAARKCKRCGEPLTRRANEKPGRFAARRFCSRGCAAAFGSEAARAKARASTTPPKPVYRNGYRMIWLRDAKPPPSQKRKRGRYAYEHRLVMEAHLDRKLEPREVVHHKNGDRLDNRPDNLELFASHSAHMTHHQRARSG